MSDRGVVLFVDDDEAMRMAVQQWLMLAGFQVTTCPGAAKALPQISKAFPGILVTDVKMPGRDGLDVLSAALERDPDLPVILITGHGDVPLAVEAMRRGAYDFIEKPFVPESLAQSVGRACEKRRLVMENRRLRALSRSDLQSRLIGVSPAMEKVRSEILALADTSLNVVIRGETGCGKELVARCLHDFSSRAGRPFVAVNCAAIPETMFEAEFFGHEAGAFTGSVQRRAGKFEHADGGTLFLDEIESMPLALQAKVLRALQEQCVEPLGGNRLVPVNVRTVTAAKLDLLSAAKAGAFREDLYYRLNVAEIHLPPLRERKADIALLFESFAHRAALAAGRAPRPLSDGDVRDLLTHDWPGNIRELRNAAERFALGLELGPPARRPADAPDSPGALHEQVARFEKTMIEAAFIQARGDVAEVMRVLDLPRRTLNEKMTRYGIERRRYVL